MICRCSTKSQTMKSLETLIYWLTMNFEVNDSNFWRESWQLTEVGPGISWFKVGYSKAPIVRISEKLYWNMQVLCLSIWIDSNPIVWDSSVEFADNFFWAAQNLTRFLCNKRTQVFWFSIFTWLTHCTFKMAFIKAWFSEKDI